MSLGEIAGYPNLPVLGDLKVGWIIATKNNMRFDMEIKGVGAEVMFYKPNGSSKYHFGFAMGDFSPTAFIPGTSLTPLKDASFKNLVFVYNPSRTAEKSAIRDLPLIFASKLPQNQPRLTFKPGLNVFGHLDIHPSGEMASLMKKVGVHDLTLPLNGGFSPKAFSKNLSGTAIKNAILDNLDLNIKLPALSVPGVSRFLTFKNGHLKIKGKTPSGARGIDVAISGDADVHVKGDRVAFKIDVEYDRAGGSSDLSFKGSTERKWTHPLGINFLDLDSLKLDIKKKKKASGASTFDIKIAAKTDIGSHSRLDVSVDVHEKNGHVTDAFFELDGPLRLSEIPGVKDIPSASHFEIDTIKISEHGIEAKTSFGGKKDLDIYLFTGSGWNLIVRQDNFAVTEFVPPLKHTPLKHVILSEAAIVLSKDGLSGPMSGFSIIAQDA